MLKSLIQIMKCTAKYLWSLIPSRRAKAVTQAPETGKKFTNGVRYMIEEFYYINSVAAARDIVAALRVANQSGKMDIDVHATYLNISRGYKIQNVHRTDNKVYIYFEASEQPIILAPHDAR